MSEKGRRESWGLFFSPTLLSQFPDHIGQGQEVLRFDDRHALRFIAQNDQLIPGGDVEHLSGFSRYNDLSFIPYGHNAE